ncbi:hypothetical protein HDU83_003699 [Entophlyctis luteolus]|nr:hypothetical protein HDU82_008932 [Entophlyctis luteolus]KAJ3345808.1 hypothetical protein HDU83_003699 [Entophlyctis luteolus]
MLAFDSNLAGTVSDSSLPLGPKKRRKIVFADAVCYLETFSIEEYDRSAEPVAELTMRDLMELYTMKQTAAKLQQCCRHA